ncbi:hypothetical protein BC832DRAFT_603256 [Gaertneriomyces semiglobifer]|nr:hypothetical protein BC832DRAFT_603256 [Gaertneriomyces semiglobifer]
MLSDYRFTDLESLPLDAWADNILALWPHLKRSDVLVDLRKTKSLDSTMNRICDGIFLEGTYLDSTYDTILIEEITPPRASEDWRAKTTVATSGMIDLTSPSPARSSAFQRALDRPLSPLLNYADNASLGLPQKPPKRIVTNGSSRQTRSPERQQPIKSVSKGPDASTFTRCLRTLTNLVQEPSSMTIATSPKAPLNWESDEDDDIIDLSQGTYSRGLAMLNDDSRVSNKATSKGSTMASTSRREPVGHKKSSPVAAPAGLDSQATTITLLSDDEDYMVVAPRQDITKATTASCVGPRRSQSALVSTTSVTQYAFCQFSSDSDEELIRPIPSPFQSVLNRSYSDTTGLSSVSFQDRIHEVIGIAPGTKTNSQQAARKRRTPASEATASSVGVGNIRGATKPRKRRAVDEPVDEDSQATVALESDEVTVAGVSGKPTKKPKDERQQEREAAKLEKQRQKEAKAAQREHETTLRKQHSAVNKIRTKYDCIKEMIVDIAPDFYAKGDTGLLAATLREAGADVCEKAHAARRAIRWRRKVDREWCDAEECWKPCSQRVEDEKFIAVRILAEDFAKIVGGLEEECPTPPGGIPIVEHFKKLSQGFPDCVIIYLIESLENYVKRRAKVNTSSASTRRKTKSVPLAELPTGDQIEEALMELQMESGNRCRVHMSRNWKETIEWVVTFSEQIGLIPELGRRSETAWAHSYSDNIKSGQTPRDTWMKMLQQVHMCTEPRAEAVASKYPTLTALYDAYEEGIGASLLANIKLQNNRNFGPQLSKRVWTVLMEEDADITLME